MPFAVYSSVVRGENPIIAASTFDDLGRKRVMIIQSDLELADLLAQQVESLGYVASIVTDGRTALSSLDGHNASPDLILLGAQLTDMSGAALTEILRAAAAYAWRLRHVPILYVVEKKQIVNSRFIDSPEVPVADYLVKPVSEKELREKMERVLGLIPQA